MIKRSDLINAHGDWLRTFHWQYFATLTFRTPVTAHGARHRLTSFFQRFAADCVYWVTESGARGLRLHAHCLLNGLSSDMRGDVISEWFAGLWSYGSVHLRSYDPSRAAAYYVSKTTGLPSADWDIIGRPVLLPTAHVQSQPE